MHSGDSRVFLWGQTDINTPVHILTGHSEAVLDLQWLNRDKLATWSKDRTLRIWAISDQLKCSLGGDPLETSSLTSLDGNSLELSNEQPAEFTLEENTETMMPQNIGRGNKPDPSMSLPIIRSPDKTHLSAAASDSPQTHSLTSLSQVEPRSLVSSVFQSAGSQMSLAQEFAQLKVENIPNLEIERVRSSATLNK